MGLKMYLIDVMVIMGAMLFGRTPRTGSLGFSFFRLYATILTITTMAAYINAQSNATNSTEYYEQVYITYDSASYSSSSSDHQQTVYANAIIAVTVISAVILIFCFGLIACAVVDRRTTFEVSLPLDAMP